MAPKYLISILSIVSFSLCAEERPEIIVAKDGTGHFTSIQSAVNSIPSDNKRPVIILVKNGVYNEKIFITQSHISIVGESQDSTRIVYAELRRNWVRDHKTDWGSAVINIDSTVTDLTLANITIYNNYGSLYGDHDHQFAVWGKGTKIIFLYCTVRADGGDTVSLWNAERGMYYHSHCTFEGWVDYVCPRGWCYITDSKFYGHNKTASLWHHGATDEDQKFVIRYSSFDGVPNFPLGRHHVDGQFYILDCVFSRNLADEQIHYPSYSPNARLWKWGERHYYYNCHREGGDYGWFRDNLSTAKNSPAPEMITASWTFGGKWDPEKELPAVLPFVSHPAPRDGSYNSEDSAPTLRWAKSRNAKSYLVYFGKGQELQRVSQGTDAHIPLNQLDRKTRYYWQVNAITGNDTTIGPLWHFTTR